jgi:hypothetical protein
MNSQDVCEYLAKIDNKTLPEWHQVTKTGLRAIDKLRYLYLAQYCEKKGIELAFIG